MRLLALVCGAEERINYGKREREEEAGVRRGGNRRKQKTIQFIMRERISEAFVGFSHWILTFWMNCVIQCFPTTFLQWNN